MSFDYPPTEEWGFPEWLICVCKDTEQFPESWIMLKDQLNYIPSPLEKDARYPALVLPRSDITDLEERLKSKDPNISGWDWGVARVRYRTEFRKEFSAVGFKYLHCPWEEMIKDNPMKEAVIEVVKMVKPLYFLNMKGKQISFPYWDCLHYTK